MTIEGDLLRKVRALEIELEKSIATGIKLKEQLRERETDLVEIIADRDNAHLALSGKTEQVTRFCDRLAEERQRTQFLAEALAKIYHHGEGKLSIEIAREALIKHRGAPPGLSRDI